MNVLNELANRGTLVAYREIQRIQESLPDQRLEFVSKTTEDLVRRNTWRPLQPAEFLSLVLDGEPGKHPASQSDRIPALGSEKGNVALLQVGEQLKRTVTLETARRFGGVSRRAIEDAARRGALKTVGKGQRRRVLVDSLLEYFPPEK